MIGHTLEVTVTEQALRLDPSERIALIGTLWDSLIGEGYEPPISDELRVELRRRLKAHRANPEAAVPWEEVKRRLARR